ncbi:L,D-transpeptidase family protein [Aquipuribacter nitratireducens]|uniref:L,D-transpeptidase n=1 Tax=Aquipuribacter nitratireducens TaxID=650104 RepID=A0ABW0GHU7_9MICO
MSRTARPVVTVLLTLAVVLLGAVAPASAGTVTVPGIERFESRLPAATSQVIVVTAPSWTTSYATLTAYERRATGWERVHGPWQARLGPNGFMIGEERVVGNRTTPAGSYSITETFGRLADPGTRMPYVQVGMDHYWVGGSESPYYNDMRLGSQGGFRTEASERLATYDPQYNYAAVIDFNRPDPVAGRGSAIFLHVNGRDATLGCVSVSQTQMHTLLRWLDPAATPQIVMGPQSWLDDRPGGATRTDELVAYDPTTGRRALLDLRADGSTRTLTDTTWSKAWTLTPVETDGTTGSELLTYNPTTGRRVLLDLRADGTTRTLTDTTWSKAWHLTPVETDGTTGSELLTYNPTTGRRALLDLRADGTTRTLTDTTWSKAWTLTPVETDGTTGSELLTYNPTTGRRVLLDLRADGTTVTLSDTTWSRGWSLTALDVDGS